MLTHEHSVRASCSNDLCERSFFLLRGCLHRQGLRNQPFRRGGCGSKAGVCLCLFVLSQLTQNCHHCRTRVPLSFYMCESARRTPGPLQQVSSPPIQSLCALIFSALRLHGKVCLCLWGALKTEMFLQVPFWLLRKATPTNSLETYSYMWCMFVDLQHQKQS